MHNKKALSACRELAGIYYTFVFPRVDGQSEIENHQVKTYIWVSVNIGISAFFGKLDISNSGLHKLRNLDDCMYPKCRKVRAS